MGGTRTHGAGMGLCAVEEPQGKSTDSENAKAGGFKEHSGPRQVAE